MDGAALDRVDASAECDGPPPHAAGRAGGCGPGRGHGAHPGCRHRQERKNKQAAVCRNGQTHSVVNKNKQKHLKPGDTAGACPAADATARPGTTTTTTSTSTTSGPTCPDLKPGDTLQTAIDAADAGVTVRLCPGAARIIRELLAGKDLTITRGAGAPNSSGIENAGDLTLRRMAVTACTSSNGVGISNLGVLTPGAHCIVERNTTSTGEGVGHGAGIANAVTLGMNEGRFVTDNIAEGGFAGGIFNLGGTVTLNQGSTVEGNDPDDCEPAVGSRH